MQHPLYESVREVGPRESSDDRLRPFLAAAAVGGVVEFGQEIAVLVRVEHVLAGVRVRSVEFTLFYE